MTKSNQDLSHEDFSMRISHQIWNDKYRHKEAAGKNADGSPRDEVIYDATVKDTWKRIAKALAAAEKPAIRAKIEQEFYDALSDFKYLPAGRIIAGAGVKRNVTLFNCLSADTGVLTRDAGLVAIGSLAGETAEILDGNGEWVEAPIMHLGTQTLFNVTMGIGYNSRNRLNVRATAGHRWVLSNGNVVTTEELEKGDTFPVVAPSKAIANMDAYHRGVVHGIVFGDGTQGKTNYSIRLCGDKNEPLEMHFTQDGWTRSNPPSSKGDRHLQISKSKSWADLKALPTTQDQDYLMGFFRGWLAADGAVAQKGGYAMLTVAADLLPFVRQWGPVVGFGVRHVSPLSLNTNYGQRSRDTVNVVLTNWTMTEEDFLLDTHKAAFKPVEGHWKVLSVEADETEEVYCAQVPSTASFVLESGVLTGNCFVMGTVPDSMDGIFEMLKEAALTMQQGGGIGYDFSTIRPKGAPVVGVGSDASGPLSFMDVWNSMCKTIMSAGSRRGAMMATMRCDHPDIEDFITAKQDSSRLRHFNLSVLVTDPFMEAVKADKPWDLVWKGKTWRTVQAREVWDLIMKSTYNYAEPGVIFIDRINQMNPIRYAETIAATNPCFTADTRVMTDKGAVTFGELAEVGTAVVRTLDKNGKPVWATMTNIRCTQEDAALMEVRLDDGSHIRCTPEHRFFTDLDVEVQAKDLRRGDLILTLKEDGTLMGTEVIESVHLESREDVYCGEVAGVHRFFLATHHGEGLLVHNCGEQPLPPYGACLLGSINLSTLIENAFEPNARMDIPKMTKLVASAVRMMDNVVDVSNFALEAQRKEAKAKRRIGLGVTGLADALIMLGLTYGTEEAVAMTDTWMRAIQNAAYRASVELAKEKGAFPLFDADKYLESPTIQRLDDDVKEGIRQHGIRNALLTSIAPTGTISLYAGNVSSGIEPVFAYAYTRKVLERDGVTRREEEVVDAAVALYRKKFNLTSEDPLPDHFVSAQTLAPLAHVRMQAAAQKWVDSSISKTINCPEDISFEDFKEVYMEAYDTGCKGCTTYRPNDVTGSVLEVKDTKKAEPAPAKVETPAKPAAALIKREEVLDGRTYKLKWPQSPHAYYVTVNDLVDEDGDRRPFEVFINTQNIEAYQWIVALTRMISAVFRRGGDVSFVAKELRDVFDPQGGAFLNGRYVHSLIAALGDVLDRHMKAIGFIEMSNEELSHLKGHGAEISQEEPPHGMANMTAPRGKSCPSCGEHTFFFENGCWTCKSCGHSKCSG